MTFDEPGTPSIGSEPSGSLRSTVSSEHLAAQARTTGLAAALASLVPTGAFLVFDRWLGLVAAMTAASVATLALMAIRRRRGGGIGVLLPVSLAYVVVKAVAGVVTESQLIYFGAGLALSAAIAVVVGVTSFTSRPVASYLIPYVTPYRALKPDHPVYRRVSAQVTMVWAIAELGMTGWEAWHLTVSSATEFVLTRTAIAWPAMGVLIFILIAYVRFRLDRHEWHLARSAA